MHSCAPEICFIFPTFGLCSLGIWVGFRVLNSCGDFSYCFGSIVNAKEGGDISKRHLYEPIPTATQGTWL